MSKGKITLLALFIVLSGIIIAVLLYNRSKTNDQSGGWKSDTHYVSVTKAVNKIVSAEVSLTGTAYPYSDINLISETSGKVTSVFFNTGDHVSKGQLLAQVDDELRLAAYENAQVLYEKMKKDFDRAENLIKSNSITESQYEAAKTGLSQAETNLKVTQRQYKDTKITSPVSGFVTQKNIDVGSTLQGPPAPSFIANISDISRLKIKVPVTEKLAFRLKKGDKAEIETDVFPGEKFTGSVASVSVKGDEAHTYPVEIEVQNTNNRLKAGMFTRVAIYSGQEEEALVIPRKALLDSKKESAVYIVRESKAVLTRIITGAESGTGIQVVSGLSSGDLVVTSGQGLLKDGTPVEIVD